MPARRAGEARTRRLQQIHHITVRSQQDGLPGRQSGGQLARDGGLKKAFTTGRDKQEVRCQLVPDGL